MRKIPLFLSASVSVLALTFSVSLSWAAEGPDDKTEIAEKTKALVDKLLVEAEMPARECTEECTEKQCSEDCPMQHDPGYLLTTLLVEVPSAVEALGPIAVDAISAKGTSEAQGDALLECLLSSRNPALKPVGTAMYEAAPSKFAPHRILGFCELGCKDLREPLAKRVAKGKAGVFEAAYLAQVGEDAGAKVLKRTMKSVLKADVLDAQAALEGLVAGHALERLGKKGACQEVRLAVHAATIDALDSDDVDRARGLVVAAMIARNASRQTQPGFSSMQESLTKTIEGAYYKDELESSDAIFALIEELTPIG